MNQIVAWSAPANIALVKYWGKKEGQLPENTSISMTLNESRTVTEVEMKTKTLKKGQWQYKYAGKEHPEFENKLKVFFDRAKPHLPFLDEVFLSIDSENNFPHSSGISSSASFMASLALSLCDLEAQYTNVIRGDDEHYQKVSFIARLGSGSASRSVYGGYTVWGKCGIEHSSDEYAVPVDSLVHPKFKNFRDAVLIISSEQKSLSSSKGHELMKDNPFAEARYQMAEENLESIIFALKTGDLDLFIEIVEQEALTLHGLIMSSGGGSILMNPQTIEAINQIRKYRRKTGSKCCFTLDAGPNIHLLYPNSEKSEITKFIQKNLVPICENEQWINDWIGKGPFKIA